MEGGDFVDTSAKHVEDDDDNDGEKDEEQNSSGENGANVREEIEPDGDEEEEEYEDEEDEEEEDEEEEDDDFLVKEGEEEEEEEEEEPGEEDKSEEETRKKKKKKRRHRELVLEEEDYELVEEHTGIRQARHQGHRRLKRAREVGHEPSNQQTAAEQLRAELFGPDADENLEDDLEDRDLGPDKEARAHTGEERELDEADADRYKKRPGQDNRKQREEVDVEDDDFFDDEDDFIVHEFEDEETAAAARAARRRRRKAAVEGLPGVDPFALEEANDIFGGLDELMQRYENRPKASGGAIERLDEDGAKEGLAGHLSGDDSDLLDEEEVDSEADEGFSGRLLGRKISQRERRDTFKAIKHLEPAAIERGFLTKRDEYIRQGDLPEREQLNSAEGPIDFDFEACADWIWKEVICESAPPSKCKDTLEEGVREVEGSPPEWMHVETWPQEYMRGYLKDTSSHRGLYRGRLNGGRNAISHWQKNQEAQDALRQNIVAVLERMYQHHEEVPLIGMFRKEIAGELLSLRHRDEPTWLDDMKREFDSLREEVKHAESNVVDFGYLGAVRPQERKARRWDTLYTIQKYAERWKVLQRRRERLASTLRRGLESANFAAEAAFAENDEKEAASVNSKESIIFAQKSFSECLDSLAMAKTFEELSDVEMKFKLAVDALSDGVSGNGTTAAEEALAALKISQSQPQASLSIDEPKSMKDIQAEREKIKKASMMATDLGGEEEKESGVNETSEAAISNEQGEKSSSILTRRRKPQRLSLHRLALRAGLTEVAEKLAITPSEFAENIEEGIAIHEPTDPEIPPTEFASQWVDPSFPVRGDADAVLKGAKSIATLKLATEPAIRNSVRQYFYANAVITTNPTSAGESTLSPFHPLGLVKRLSNKPLSSFDGTDVFLRILNAEKDGLITMTIGLKTEEIVKHEGLGNEKEIASLGAYVEQLQNLYLSSGTSEGSQAWNEVRLGILKDALKDIVIPELEQEARVRLSINSIQTALEKMSARLWEYASSGPLQIEVLDSHGDSTGEIVSEPRIMSVVWGPTLKAPTTFVMLDLHGNMVDFLQCPQFSGSIPRGRAIPGVPYRILEDPKKSRDAIRIREFMESHLPHALLLGVGHPEALVLYDDIVMIHEHIVDENPRAFASNENGDLAKYLIDETVATAWEHSEAAREELPSAHALVRRAVALARQAINPLAVLASLAGRNKEILSIQLHPLQSSIPEDQRWKVIEETLVSATANVGIDLNAAISTPWLSSPLPFVPGLGPRKSKAMMRGLIRTSGYLLSRKDLVKNLSGCIGPIVFKNAAPYIRVRPSSSAVRNMDINPLDDTRIELDSYDHALALAMSAVRDVDADIAVESAMGHPDDVAALDLSKYLQHLQNEMSTSKASIQIGLPSLIDIQFELIAPYGEIRQPFAVLRKEDAFWVAVGDRGGHKDEWRSFKKGRKVEAKIRWVGDDLARCVLSEFSGLDVIIKAENVSSRMRAEDINCRNYFKVGDTVVAVIHDIDPAKRTVNLATDSASLNSDLEWEYHYFCREAREKYYRVPDRKEIERKERDKLKVSQLPFVPRFIQHPLFRNISMMDAEEDVRRGAVGTALIRPAARSPNKLYLSMHIPGGVVWHIQINEMGQTSQNLRLAPPLQISLSDTKQYVYDDLDEFAARFVDPVSAMMQSLANHRKWKGTVATSDGTLIARPWNQGEQSVQSLLKEDKKRNPSVVAYCMAADTDAPGLFYIGRIIGSTPRRERFSILPTGFYFREKEFGYLDKLLDAFRREPQYLENQERDSAQAREYGSRLEGTDNYLNGSVVNSAPSGRMPPYGVPVHDPGHGFNPQYGYEAPGANYLHGYPDASTYQSEPYATGSMENPAWRGQTMDARYGVDSSSYIENRNRDPYGSQHSRNLQPPSHGGYQG